MPRVVGPILACWLIGLILTLGIVVGGFRAGGLIQWRPVMAGVVVSYHEAGDNFFWRSFRASRWYGTASIWNRKDAEEVRSETRMEPLEAVRVFGAKADEWTVTRVIGPYDSQVWLHEAAAGWPFRCVGVAGTNFDARGVEEVFERMPIDTVGLRGMSPAMNFLCGHSAYGTFGWIRLGPLAVNAALIGMMLLVCVRAKWAVRWVRRWHRRRNGRCEQCGYKREGIGHGAPCPECGERPCDPASAAPPTTVRP